MRGFVVGTIVTAIAFYVLTKVLPDLTGFDLVTYDGELIGIVVLALIFGVVNALIGRIVRLLTLPISFMTMGLVGFVINAGLLLRDGGDRERGQVRPDGRRLPAGPAHRRTPSSRRSSARSC